MRKILFLFLVLIVSVLVYRQVISPLNDPFSREHNKLIEMNSCKKTKDCKIIYGSENTKCYYLINSIFIDQAITNLKKTGTMTNICKDINIASGVVCLNSLCVFGDGVMTDPIKW